MTTLAHTTDCDCYGCKLRSFQFTRSGHKTHQHKGDPWAGNPVKERIEELQAQGRRVTAVEIVNNNPTQEKDGI